MYGLRNVQDRGVLFFGPGIEVYKGQVVGQNARQGDLAINICKEKQLSNMRSKGDGSDVHFKTPKTMDLDAALEYIGDDELVEVTPKNIRMRKVTLFAQKRKKWGLIVTVCLIICAVNYRWMEIAQAKSTTSGALHRDAQDSPKILAGWWRFSKEPTVYNLFIVDAYSSGGRHVGDHDK